MNEMMDKQKWNIKGKLKIEKEKNNFNSVARIGVSKLYSDIYSEEQSVINSQGAIRDTTIKFQRKK